LKPFFIYLLVASIHLASILAGEDFVTVVMITKPLLLLSLLIIFWSLTRNQPGAFRNFVLAGLFFSWTGDVILLFQEKSPDFFIFGLVSFLIAHICYIIAFRRTELSGSQTILREKPWLIAPFACYGVGFFMLIREGLGAMMVPVVIYMIIILLMGIAALNRFRKVPYHSFLMVFTGALFFMVSDSLLAVNKFYSPFPQSGFLIMLTYIIAQFLIVKGSWLQIQSQSYKASHSSSIT
jgi:uncharacterized membrane protein YhhN